MKKLISTALILVMLLSLCSCTIVDTGALPSAPSADTPDEKAPAISGVANPMTEADPESLLEDMGLDFSPLAGYENVKFFKIKGNPVVAHITFDYNGDSYTYRVATPAEKCDISGMYYEWSTQEAVAVSYCDAQVHISDGGQGYIDWYDAAPGVLYCISMDANATADKLSAMADMLFVPTQGDAAGDYDPMLIAALDELHTTYFPGTAGSSISGAVCAAKLADLLTQAGGCVDIAGAVSQYCSALSSEEKTVFFSQLSGVSGSFYAMCADGTGILSDGGYTPATAWDQEALKSSFDAMVDCVREIPFAAILDRYYTVIDQDWSMEALIENNYNMMLGYVESLDDIGYAVIDLDGDGSFELVIGAIAENDEFLKNLVYDLFALNEEGSAVNVFSSQERSRYYYAGESSFNYHGSGSAAVSVDNVQHYAHGAVTETGAQPAATVSLELTPFSALY